MTLVKGPSHMNTYLKINAVLSVDSSCSIEMEHIGTV
jgi:hypothetical protein